MLAKMSMLNLRFPLKLYLINNVDDVVVFVCLKMFNSNIFHILEMRESLL